jgi:citrate lyase alpha subunit
MHKKAIIPESAISSCNLQLLYAQVVFGRMPIVVVVEISVVLCCCASNSIHVVTKCVTLALLLPRKSFVEERQHFRNIKLDIFEIEIILSIFLHLK